MQYVENPMAPNFVSESMSQTGFVRVRRLLLLLGGILLFIGLLFGLDQAEVVKSLVSTGLAQGLVGGELSLVLGDRAGSLGGVNLHHRNDSFRRDLRGDIHLLLGGVSLVRLGKLLGEEDKLRAVLLQALNVLLKRLNALVAATVINGDADGSGKVLVKTGGLDLL